MQVTVEKLGSCQAKISFTIPGNDFHGTVQEALKERAASANLKGFRPGKVPVQIIEKQFGKEVRGAAIEHYVQQAFQKAVQEHQLKVVGFQRVNLDELIDLPAGQDLSSNFEVSLRPEIVLGAYTGLEIESALAPVMDQEVDDAIANLKQQQSRPEPAGDEGLADDGVAIAKIEWIVGGESVLSAEGHRIAMQQPTPGVDEAKWKAALSGAKDGDAREVEMTIPATFNKEQYRGMAGTTRVTVVNAYKLVPPSDAEVQQMLGVQGDAALKDFVRQELGRQKEMQELGRVEGELLQRLIGSHAFELPTMMVQEQARGRLSQFEAQLRQQQAPEDVVRSQIEANKENALKAAENGLRALFLVQAIGEKENLLVTKQDMEAELVAIAQRNNAKPEDVQKFYQEQQGGFDQLAIEILERKVRKFLRENAKLTKPK